MDEFVSTCETLHSREARSEVRVSFRPNIHRIEIVSDIFLLVFLDVHQAILDKIVYMEGTIDRDLVIVWAKSVQLSVLI
jgi:hypothetical protein